MQRLLAMRGFGGGWAHNCGFQLKVRVYLVAPRQARTVRAFPNRSLHLQSPRYVYSSINTRLYTWVWPSHNEQKLKPTLGSAREALPKNALHLHGYWTVNDRSLNQRPHYVRGRVFRPHGPQAHSPARWMMIDAASLSPYELSLICRRIIRGWKTMAVKSETRRVAKGKKWRYLHPVT